MKLNFLLSFFAFTILIACQSNDAALSGTSCYLAAYGENPTAQDKEMVQLTIKGKAVTGTYDWVPAGNVAAKGTLKGTIDGNIIRAVYSRLGEGEDYKEELWLKVESGELFFKRGQDQELVDGGYKMKAPDKVAFGKSIPKVKCGSH